MSRKEQIKKLEKLGYDVIEYIITKEDSERTPLYIANFTEQREIEPMYSRGNLEALKFSAELKEICKKEDWTYLENEERLIEASEFLENLKEEISKIEKKLLEN